MAFLGFGGWEVGFSVWVLRFRGLGIGFGEVAGLSWTVIFVMRTF